MSDTPGDPDVGTASDGHSQPPDDVPIEALPPPDPAGRVTSGAEIVGTAGKSARDRAAQIEQDARNWATGAHGEELTDARLRDLPPGFVVLHDLHVPASRANIDHLVVGPTGVWLIDTKTYSNPLRFNGGTIWTGSHPCSDDIEKILAYTRRTEAVLHVPVTPVLCFVGQAVPDGADTIAGVRLVTLDDLLTLVSLNGIAPLSDVESITRLARTLRTPTPAARPDAAPPRPNPPARRPAPAPVKAARAARPVRGIWKVVIVLLALAALGKMIGPARTKVAEVTAGPTSAPTTLPVPPLDGPTIASPSGPAGVGLVCVTRGEGWQAGFHWPTPVDPAQVPVAYEVVSLTPGIVVEPKLWLSEQALPDPLTGLPPNLDLVFAAQGILADGTRLTPAVSTRITGDAAC